MRTVQRWERLAGLPVYRQGAGKNARVFAQRDELRAWVETGAAAAAKPGEWRGRAGLLWLAAGGFLGLGATLTWLFGLWSLPVKDLLPLRGQPSEWRLEGGKLRVFDARGRLCWQRAFGQTSANWAGRDEVLIADLDGDGRQEVLYNHAPANLGEDSGVIYCLEHDGTLRWRFSPGGRKTFLGREFSPVYEGALLRVVRLEERSLVLVVANHSLYFPSQTVLLDPADGTLLEEYWHPGAIRRCVIHDLDGDGRPEAVLAGVNNPGLGLGHPALAVLALPFSRAARRETEAAQFAAVTGGGELAYLLFPRPDVSTVLGFLSEVDLLRIEDDRMLVVRITLPEGAAMLYHLDFRLSVLEHRFSDNFPPLHRRLRRQGLLDRDLSEREMAALGRVARFPHAPDGNDPRLAEYWRR